MTGSHSSHPLQFFVISTPPYHPLYAPSRAVVLARCTPHSRLSPLQTLAHPPNPQSPSQPIGKMISSLCVSEIKALHFFTLPLGFQCFHPSLLHISKSVDAAASPSGSGTQLWEEDAGNRERESAEPARRSHPPTLPMPPTSPPPLLFLSLLLLLLLLHLLLFRLLVCYASIPLLCLLPSLLSLPLLPASNIFFLLINTLLSTGPS